MTKSIQNKKTKKKKERKRIAEPKKKAKKTPPGGFEPPTSRLTAVRSANWAKEDQLFAQVK